MTQRFADLRKVPKEPAARLLAGANARLKTPLRSPVAALVPVVLAELDQAGAWIDMLRLLSVALPPRERVWWACLAGRDLVGVAGSAGGGRLPLPLAAAEAWVFKPTDAARDAARAAAEAAEPDDDTTLCATAVIFFDGTLGSGALARQPAPPGVAQAAAFGMNLIALGLESQDFAAAANRLVDRGLDIARGGNGRGGDGRVPEGGVREGRDPERGVRENRGGAAAP